MNDAVTISNLTLRVHVGYETPERQQPQDIAIDLVMRTDFTKVIRSGDVNEDGVNYSTVRHAIEDFVKGREFKMLEGLAEEILQLIFVNERIKSATIAIRKPQRWQNAIPGVMTTRKNNRRSGRKGR